MPKPNDKLVDRARHVIHPVSMGAQVEQSLCSICAGKGYEKLTKLRPYKREETIRWATHQMIAERCPGTIFVLAGKWSKP